MTRTLITAALCFFLIKLPLNEQITEVCFLLFSILFFIYNVFFEEKSKIIDLSGAIIYTCIFIYLSDFSLLELLSSFIIILSFIVKTLSKKNNKRKSRI